MKKINIFHRMIFSILATKDWKKLKQENFLDKDILDFFIYQGLSVWMFIFSIGTIPEGVILHVKNDILSLQFLLCFLCGTLSSILSKSIYKKHETKIKAFLSGSIAQDNNKTAIKNNVYKRSFRKKVKS